MQTNPEGDSFLQPPAKEDEENENVARNPFLLADGVYLKSELINTEKPTDPEGEPNLQASLIPKKIELPLLTILISKWAILLLGKK